MDWYEKWNIELDKMPEKLQYIKLYEFRTKGGQLIKDTFRPKYRPGKKRYNYSTVEAEGVKPFIHNYSKIRKKYKDEFNKEIKIDQRRIFFNLLKEWSDGKIRRNGEEIKKLKKDIYNYLIEEYPTLYKDKIFCEECVTNYKSGGLKKETIKKIIELNSKYINKYMDTIIEDEDEEYHIPDDELMLHRGINIKRNNLVSTVYKEKNFLSSYSLSVSPKFSAA